MLRWLLALAVVCDSGCQVILGFGDTVLESADAASTDTPLGPGDGALDAPVASDADAPPDVPVPDVAMVADSFAGPDVLDAPIADAPITEAGVDGNTPLFSFSLAPPSFRVVRGSDAATATATVTRLPGFTGAVTLSFDTLPIGVTAPAVAIASGQTSGTISVSASAMAQLGPTSVVLRGSGGGYMMAQDVSLTVADRAGTIDETFNGGSYVSMPLGSAAYGPARVLVRPGGAIVFATFYGSAAAHTSAFVQVDSSGHADSGFGTLGVTPVPNFVVGDMALADDGTITAIGTGDTSTTTFVRLDGQGGVDTGFGGAGRPDAGVVAGGILDERGNYPTAIVAQSTGALVYAQNDVTRSFATVCRLLSTGLVDADFAGGASCYYSMTNQPTSLRLALDPGDEIYVGGTWMPQMSAFYLAHLSSEGVEMRELGYPTSAGSFYAFSTAVSNGEPLVAGFETAGNENTGGMTRLAANGLPDTGFGTNANAIVTGDFGDPGSSKFTGVATLANGELVVVGETLLDGQSIGFVARYHGDGTPDADFGTDGVTLMPDANGLFYVAIAPDGRIVASGTTPALSVYIVRVWN